MPHAPLHMNIVTGVPGGNMPTQPSPQAPAARPQPQPPCPCRDPGPARPLPDLAGVRLAAVPECAPPYDGEERAPDGRERASTGTFCPPRAPENRGSAPCRDPQGGEGQSRGGHGEPPRNGDGAPGDRGNAARPAAGDWPSQFAQVLAETLAGCRPASQVAPWTTERARANIRKLGPLLAA